MKKLILALILVIGLSSVSYGEGRRVNLWFNGELWNSPELSSKDFLAQTMKVYLIRGVYEGIYYVNPKKLCSIYTCERNYEDLVMALDKFYGDDENIKIPIVDALELVSMEIKGKDKTLIQEKLRILRDTYRDLVPE
jgi:hypothetical protein